MGSTRRLPWFAVIVISLFLALPNVALACGCNRRSPAPTPAEAPIVQSAAPTPTPTLAPVQSVDKATVSAQRSPVPALIAGWHRIDLGTDEGQKFVRSGFELPDHDPNTLPCQIGDFTDWTGLYQQVGQDNSVDVPGLVAGIDLEMYIGVESGIAHDWWNETVNGMPVTSSRRDAGPEWIYYERIPGSWITGPDAVVNFHNTSDQAAGKARTYFIIYHQAEVA